MLKIEDTRPSADSKVQEAYQRSEDLLDAIPADKKEIIISPLIAPLDDLEDYVEKCLENGSDILLDITSFPKRWFFPLTQMLINDTRVRNLVAVYTQGDNYAESIAENPEMLRTLPGFPSSDERRKHDHAFIGVGFHDLGMLKLLGDDRVTRLNLLFPFPPGPPGNQKNWKFVEQITRKIGSELSSDDPSDPLDLHFLPALDTAQSFSAMCNITQNGQQTSIMAPYGPKPVSLAMCLFAIACDDLNLADVPVYYSQPQRYAIDYTEKASSTDGNLHAWGYALKLNGGSLYTLPK